MTFNRIRTNQLFKFAALAIGAACAVLGQASAASAADGDLDTTFNAAVDNGQITAVVAQTDGKIIGGGTFTTVGGQARNGIARLNAGGSLDAAFAANASGAVSATVPQADDKLLIGGAFTTVNGQARLRVARLLNNPGTAATRRAVLDFDGDGKSDYAIARAADAVSPTVWYINNSANQTLSAVQFGTGVRGFGFTPPADIAAPEDFDGDGKTDIAVWRRANGTFYVLRSGDGGFQAQQWGQQGDYPVAYYNAH